MMVTPNFKVERVRCERHLAYIRTLPCCACRRQGATVAHHLTCGPEPKARGMKASDSWTVPLCIACHDAGHPGSLHHAGDEDAWWQAKRRDPIAIAVSLWADSVEAGRARSPAPRSTRKTRKETA